MDNTIIVEVIINGNGLYRKYSSTENIDWNKEIPDIIETINKSTEEKF